MDTNADRILPEILLQVFSYLPFLDIYSVSQVSHAWRFWSQKQFYSEPMLTESTSVPLFLRTLLTPGLECLAAHVRDLDVRSRPFDRSIIDQSDSAIIRGAATRLGLGHPAVSTSEHILLLLHLLPRLDVLTLNLPDEPDTLDNFLCGTHEPEDLPAALRSISRFWYTWPPRESDQISQKLLTIFGLPRVHTLLLFALGGMGVSFPTSQHHSSAVTALVISNSVIASSSPGHMLHLPRALTRLYFTGSITDVAGLQAAMEPLRMTLQELEFVIEDDPWSAQVAVRPPPQSFRTWPVLRCLRCQLMFLLGCTLETDINYLEHVLPPCIRYFGVITEGDWNYNDVGRKAAHLMGGKQMVVPELERFVCFTGWMDVEVAQLLLMACVDAGVVLTNDW